MNRYLAAAVSILSAIALVGLADLAYSYETIGYGLHPAVAAILALVVIVAGIVYADSYTEE